MNMIEQKEKPHLDGRPRARVELPGGSCVHVAVAVGGALPVHRERDAN